MKEHIVHSGAWGPALIVAVMASWLLYRYLAQARAEVHPALGQWRKPATTRDDAPA